MVKNTEVGGNGSHSSGIGAVWDFPPVISWDWDGTRFFFVGVGRERFENPLPYHPLFQSYMNVFVLPKTKEDILKNVENRAVLGLY